MVKPLNESYYDELMLSQHQPSRISHADGYKSLCKNGEATFYYTLFDHLGNVRLVMQAGGSSGILKQTNDYYPFGMAFTKNVADSEEESFARENKYKYNRKFRHSRNPDPSKEEQEMPGRWLDYGARFYDAQLGRWHSVDALANDEMQIDKSPYTYAWNNPTNIIDPDGNCPWCIGAIAGAVVDYGLQVAVNFAEGKPVIDAITDVDGGSILVSAGAGALSGGLSVASKIKTGSKLVKIASSEVGEMVIDAAASVTNQLVKEGEVDLVNTVVDVTVGKVIGNKVGEVAENAAKQSPQGKVLSRQLDRAERVAGDNPRPSRAQKVEQAKKAQAVHTANRTTATSVSSTGVASEAIKQAKSALTVDKNEHKTY